jgi:methylated-DNA-[protein]-cysteine S-methyltransferase
MDTPADSVEAGLSHINQRFAAVYSHYRCKTLIGVTAAISHLCPADRLQGMTTRHAMIDSPLGELTLVADDDALIGLYFRNHWYRPPSDAFGLRVDADDDTLLRETSAQLGEFFVGGRAEFKLPTELRGDERQRRIWDRLTTIPYGDTVTYGELAAELADGSTPQEVGAAVGRNPLCIVIPCHRVVGKDGKLTGYAGGLERKKSLLDLEEPAEVRAGRLF